LDRWDLSSLPPTTAVAIALRLARLGSGSRGEQVLRPVQQVHPSDFSVNHVLYELVAKTPARREEALGFLRVAVAVKPDSPGAHRNLGVVLKEQGKREEAEKECRRALHLKEDFPRAHNTLGTVLAEQGKWAEAEKEYRRALQLKEDYPAAHTNLGVLLAHQGKFGEAILSLKRALELFAPDDSRRTQVQKSLSRYQHLQELDEKLPAILNSEGEAKAPEKVEFADLCRYKGRYSVAVRFYEEAFAKEPKLAADLAAWHRYNAACAAALAGCGKGEDANLDDKERARLRQQARDWLTADLAIWTKKADGDAKAHEQVQQTLQQWQADADLAGIRDPEALAKLPKEERDACRKLWAEVEAVRKKVASQP
jgi:Flp pilus assembly protein TadD